MLNFIETANNTVVRDNELVLNHQIQFKLTDDEMKQVYALLSSFSGVQQEAYVATPVSAPFQYTSDATTKYEVLKNGNMYQIRDCSFYKTAQHRLGNEAIKGLMKEHKELVAFTYANKNGKQVTGWGCKKKAEAEALVKLLPTSFTAEELEANRQSLKK